MFIFLRSHYARVVLMLVLSCLLMPLSSCGGSSAGNGASQGGSNTPPIPVAGARSWPSKDNTGASGVLVSVSGEVILDTAGQVYENKQINGQLTITACGVTVRNVEVVTGNTTLLDNYGIWLKHPDTCTAPVTLDHVTVRTTTYVTTGIRNAYGATTNVLSSKVIGTQDGIFGFGSGLIQDSYIEIGATQNGDHNDGIQIGGSNGLTIKHNTVINPNTETSALALFTEYGPNQNLLVRDNLLAGGGFTCYCGDGKADNLGNPARAVNVDFINNVFWKVYYPNVGYFDAGRAYNTAGGGEWTNNLYMEKEGTLTSNLVPQPPIDQ